MSEKQRSSFVSVLAWIFIVLAGFATLISLLQNIMISTMFPTEEMNKAFSEPQAQEDIPLFAKLMFSNIRLFFFSFLVISATTLVSALALLKRKNWARIAFMVIMCLGICWNIFALVMQNLMFTSMPEVPANEMDAEFGTFMVVMKIFSFVMAVGLSYLFGWIVYRLSSDSIKAEFMFSRSTTPSFEGPQIPSGRSNKTKTIVAASVVLTIAIGVFYFTTGNIEVGANHSDIQELAISGDDQRLADLLSEQPHLANATRENTGWTPLHGAACNGNTQCVNLLVDAGADVNVQACNNFTPLHCAAEDGYTEIAEILLAANANPNILDSKGKTPLDHAMWENHRQVALLLKEYGGKTSEEISGPQETSGSD